MSEELEKIQAELAEADNEVAELQATKADLEDQLAEVRKAILKALKKRDPLRLKEMKLITAESGPSQKIGN